MRYDKRVLFKKKLEPVFDENTGNYTNPGSVVYPMTVSVSPVSIKTAQIIFGNAKVQALTVKTHRNINKDFDLIEIDKRNYRVESSERFRNSDIYYVTEVPDEY